MSQVKKSPRKTHSGSWQSLFEKAAKDAATKQIIQNPHIQRQEPELKEYLFQVAFTKLLEIKSKDKIDFNHPGIGAFLFTKALGAIKDEIRNIVPMKRSQQQKLKFWTCPNCAYETNYYQHRIIEKQPSVCPCGTKIHWEYNSNYQNPMHVTVRESDLIRDLDARHEKWSLQDFIKTNETNPHKICEIADEVASIFRLVPRGRMRQVFKLYFIDELTMQEIAVIFDRTESWASITLKKAIEEYHENRERRNGSTT